MLRIAKVKAGGERYYFSTVAASSDLPAGLVEADPYWIGEGAAALGLTGTPTPSDVRAVLRGVDPASGKALDDGHGRRVSVVAFDVTMSVPKSVSVLHALAGPEAARSAERAHAEAVRAVFAHAEGELLSVWRKAAGQRFQLSAEGGIAVCFPHRTSRAEDPHLHTHLLLANLARGTDGRWSAFDGRPLFTRQRELRALYEAHVRAELSDLGVVFGPMRGDFADVRGLSGEVVAEFSRQARRIAEALRATGDVSAAEASRLAAWLRPAKDRSRSYEELRLEWERRGHRVGLSPSRLAASRGGAASLPAPVRPEWSEQAAERGDGTFSFSDLLVARAKARPEGERVSEVTAAVRAAVEAGDLVPIGSRFTTAARQAELEAASRQIASLAASVGARYAGYRAADGRSGGLHALRSGLSGHAVALAAGPRAARRFEAVAGIETYPIAARKDVMATLAPGATVVVADANAMVADELRDVFRSSQQQGLRTVVFGEESALGRCRLLEGALAEMSPLPSGALSGPRLREEIAFGATERAVITSTPPEALEAARAEAVAALGLGAAVVLALPDRVLKQELGAPSGVRVTAAARAVDELTDLPDGEDEKVLVVLGGAASLEAPPGRLARFRRVHVLVRPVSGAGYGLAAEAVRPARLLSQLGPARTGPVGRLAWREAAALEARSSIEHVEPALPVLRRRERSGRALGL